MEEGSSGRSISIGGVVDSSNKEEGLHKKVAAEEKSVISRKKDNNGGGGKRGRFDRCFSSFAEISSPSPDRPLENVDSKKFKEDIKKWAKSVATYARQLSDRFGNSSSSSGRQ